jgi:hypothetical protein
MLEWTESVGFFVTLDVRTNTDARSVNAREVGQSSDV